jgi:hypothetical protein
MGSTQKNHVMQVFIPASKLYFRWKRVRRDGTNEQNILYYFLYILITNHQEDILFLTAEM